MEPFAGFEPYVGDIRALRTFRVGPGGELYPLFHPAPWVDGPNTARCLSTRAGGDGHDAPEPDCTCGFYAYGNEGATTEQLRARHVLVVVACWGRVIAGTRGVRAQYCRIEAVWLSAAVPEQLVSLVRSRYPSAAVYRDRSAMLAEHAPTELDCYEAATPFDRLVSRALRALAVAGIVVGTVPGHWLDSVPGARTVWVVLLGALLVGALVLGSRRSSDLAAQRRRLLCLAVVLWMVAPVAGPPGMLLLRLPLVEVAVLGIVQRLQALGEARRFPSDIG
jgi:hypothetical protein